MSKYSFLPITYPALERQLREGYALKIESAAAILDNKHGFWPHFLSYELDLLNGKVQPAKNMPSIASVTVDEGLAGLEKEVGAEFYSFAPPPIYNRIKIRKRLIDHFLSNGGEIWILEVDADSLDEDNEKLGERNLFLYAKLEGYDPTRIASTNIDHIIDIFNCNPKVRDRYLDLVKIQ